MRDLVSRDSGRFDVIRLNWSLEHIHDPVGLFRLLQSVSHPRTKVIVTVPNYEGLTYSVFPDCIEVPVHLQYFTPSSMSRLCDLTGFRVEHLHTFSTPSVIACAIALMEGKKPNSVLMMERRRILDMMDEAHLKGKGDELFCVLSPFVSKGM